MFPSSALSVTARAVFGFSKFVDVAVAVAGLACVEEDEAKTLFAEYLNPVAWIFHGFNFVVGDHGFSPKYLQAIARHWWAFLVACIAWLVRVQSSANLSHRRIRRQARTALYQFDRFLMALPPKRAAFLLVA